MVYVNAGFYLLLALCAKHLGSEYSTYLHKKRALVLMAGGRSKGQSIDNPPQLRVHLQNGVLLSGSNKTAWVAEEI